MRLKVVSYNVLDGAADRCERVERVIQKLEPDVVGLVEADDPAVVARLARGLRMHHVMARGQDRPGKVTHSVALLSRWPVVSMLNLGRAAPLLNKGALCAVLHPGHEERPTGRPWSSPALRVVVTHLQAHISEEHEAQRLEQVESMLRVLDLGHDAALPTLLLGDFNANAPHHPTDPSRMRPDERAMLQEQGGNVPTRVVERLLNAGYTDCYHAARATGQAHSFTTEHPAQRVDYVWARPLGADGSRPGASQDPGQPGPVALRLLDADVEQAPPAAQASDHFPVWALFDWQ